MTHPLEGLKFAQSIVLPMPPTDRDVAKRIVRHGLRDVLRWLGEEVGPAPFAKTHAMQIGDTVYVSRDLWADLEGMRLTAEVAEAMRYRWNAWEEFPDGP